MNQDENRSREEWYRTQAHGDPPEGQTPSLPEDAATNFQLDPPHRASGTSQTYAEPYRSESERPPGNTSPTHGQGPWEFVCWFWCSSPPPP